MTDIELGRSALKAFWEEASEINPNIPETFEKFLEGIRMAYFPKDESEKWPGYENWKTVFYPKSSAQAVNTYLEGVGLAIRSAEVEDEIPQAMKALANQGGGRIPGNQQDFFNAIQNQAQIFKFFPALKFVVSETASEITSGFQSIGDALIKYKTYLIAGGLVVAALALYTTLGGRIPVRMNPKRRRR